MKALYLYALYTLQNVHSSFNSYQVHLNYNAFINMTITWDTVQQLEFSQTEHLVKCICIIYM